MNDSMGVHRQNIHSVEPTGMTVIHVITGLGDGGAEGVLFRICANDTENTHHVVSMMGEGKYGSILRDVGVEVTTLDMPRGRLTWSGLRRLFTVIRAHPDAVIQTWMYHADVLGGLIARLAGNRRVIWNIRHTNLDPDVTPRATRIVAIGAALLSRVVPTTIIVCAEAARQSHVELGYRASKFVVIPNGYDLDTFRPYARESLPSKVRALGMGAAPIIAMVGRFCPQKDHENLLDALALLRDRGTKFRCLLVGTGVSGDNAQLVGWIAERKLDKHTTLLGPRPDIGDLMNLADLHVLSSNDEGFPNVVAEAMACGTPCVTTAVGDAALIVGETGWVVPSRSPNHLADAIDDALRTLRQAPATWKGRQETAVARIRQEFLLDSMITSYRAVWRQALSASKR